jgi:glycosyltransferase involved in cell wall biosynthesis
MDHNKIVIVGPVPPPYHGVSLVTKMILASQLKEQYHLTHLDTSDRRTLANIGRIDLRNVWLSIKHIYALTEIITKNKADIAYIPICQTVKGLLRDMCFIALCKMKKMKVVVHLHGGYLRRLYKKSNPFGKLLIRKVCEYVNAAIVLGKSLRQIFKDLVPPEKIFVVPNGIDDLYNNDMDCLFVRRDGNKKVLFLSSLRKSKGYFDVIYAIPQVLKFCNSVEFVFAGECRCTKSDKRHILDFLNYNDLNARANFIGVVIGEEKAKLLINSDIFVFPTFYKYEGHPLVILEAMAAGLPIITTDRGAIRETVVDGENGFIVEKQNPKQIAERIIQLLEDVDLRKKMGKKSRERFLKYYTKDKFINRLASVFEKTLKC